MRMLILSVGLLCTVVQISSWHINTHFKVVPFKYKFVLKFIFSHSEIQKLQECILF